MKTTKTLAQISSSKGFQLSEILVSWQYYTEETVILAYSEIKRRGIQINEEIEKLITAFSDAQGKPISQLETELFESKNVANYQEYYNSLPTYSEISNEESHKLEKLRRDQMFQRQAMEKKDANKDVLYGGIWFVGGLAVTLVSVASGKGGFIAYGAVIFGGIQFFRGLMKS
ncbi:hypothetical protein OF897_17730 [Chryseobacterium formosus]|uniref:Uncharacterized protein n=1 Tax=Chryseobacterium formosus TaxID=1537363 RepID=A0ABT3XVW5_9FLAO|nr:hypothetical protein [Chryseobacterium formosus]MCX8525758.1 hypothetical protein [Chryseobacterium formosus]